MKKLRKTNKKQDSRRNTHFFIPESINEATEYRKRRLRARRRIVSTASITFEQLQRCMIERVDQPGFPRKTSLPNLVSALNSFLAANALEFGHPVGSALRIGYYKALKLHLSRLKAEGRSPAYVANRKSLLKAWRRLVSVLDQESAAQTGSMTPLQRVLQDVLNAGATMKGIAREVRMPFSTLRRLCAGGVPTGRSMRYLPRLELFFGMPAGTLTDLIGGGLSGNAKPAVPKVPIAYRDRLSQQARDPYVLKKRSVGESLVNEWTALLRFKTTFFVSNRTVDATVRGRTPKWRLRAGVPPVYGDWVDTLNGRMCPSASIAFGMTCQFFGWLSLDSNRGGLGMSASAAQSLGHFVNTEYVCRYLEWRIERSGGIPNHTLTRVLQFARSLCHPAHGFFIGRPDLGARVGIVGKDEWEARCREAHKCLYAALQNLPKMSMARDPFEPISAILELENPLSAIVDAIRRLDGDRPVTGGIKEAVWARDRLLLALTASNPLRAMNLKMLTWQPDNMGMLRKDSGGGWEIVIVPSNFKNQSGAAGGRAYKMPVQEHLWPFISVYLRDYWPVLARGQCDRIFVSAKTPGKLWGGLNRRFEFLTRRYLHGCSGVGPHSFRHIVATALIKRTGSFAAAALVLHDREQTVRQHYGHLVGADGARWLATVLSDAFKRM